MPGKRSALIIASDTYQDPQFRRLRAPGHDAEQLAAVLGDPHIGNFEVQTSINQRSYDIRLALEDFFTRGSLEDLLLVHFSCHGIKDEAGRFFFVASDTQKTRLNATGVSADYVNDLLQHTRSRQTVLLLDCCFSGAFTGGMLARADRSIDAAERFGGRGRAVLTASSALEYAWEGDDLKQLEQPSIFTSAIVRGLKTGDADRDGDYQVSIDDLYDYVYEEVRRATPNQTPGKWSDVRGSLIIARSPQVPPAPPVAALPADLVQAIASTYAGVREGAVAELGRLLHGPDVGLRRAAELALAELAHDDSKRVSDAAARLQAELTPAELTPAELTQTAERTRPAERSLPVSTPPPLTALEPVMVPRFWWSSRVPILAAVGVVLAVAVAILLINTRPSGSGQQQQAAQVLTLPPTPTATVLPTALPATTAASRAFPTRTPESRPIGNLPATATMEAAKKSMTPLPITHDEYYFKETGYRAEFDYDFKQLGGLDILGYPVSRAFTFIGCHVQFFQRVILHVCPGEETRYGNVLDADIFPYTHVNGMTLPEIDPELQRQAPSVSSVNYAADIVRFSQANTPDVFDGKKVNFWQVVQAKGGVDLFGPPTARPQYEPTNRQLIYMRFQRGVLVYDAAADSSRPLDMADYLKQVILGPLSTSLPADLKQQASGSYFYGQYCRDKERWLCRPDELPDTDFAFAFEPG